MHCKYVRIAFELPFLFWQANFKTILIISLQFFYQAINMGFMPDFKQLSEISC